MWIVYKAIEYCCGGLCDRMLVQILEKLIQSGCLALKMLLDRSVLITALMLVTFYEFVTVNK